jgi:DNA-3-methyladenine glycosylase II
MTMRQHTLAARQRFTLEPVPPFRLDLTVWALRRRPHNAVDQWDGDTYRRTLLSSDGLAVVEVRQEGPAEAPRLLVSVTTDVPGSRARDDATAVLQRMLGTDIDLRDFYRHVEGDRHLGPLVERFRGLKPPRFPSVFECLVNAVACQQLSLTVGLELLNRLAERYGRRPSGGPDTPPRAFPDPADLAVADVAEIRRLGFSVAKAVALVELAGRVSDAGLDLDRLACVEDAAASAVLQSLRGIGRWSAEYALLRGLGRLDVFPGDDVGARNNLKRLLGLAPGADYSAIRRAVSPWSPYAGLAYFHLLLDRLDVAGCLNENPDADAHSEGTV